MIKKSLIFILLFFLAFISTSVKTIANKTTIFMDSLNLKCYRKYFLETDENCGFTNDKYIYIYNTISELTMTEHHHLHFTQMCNPLGIKQFIYINDYETGSYYIYDHNSNQIVEASLEYVSPFIIIDYDIIPIYSSVGNYYYIKDNHLYDSKGNYINDYNQNLVEYINDNYNNDLIEYNNSNITASVQNTRSFSEYEIANSYFFRNSQIPDINNGYGYNVNGSCGYVALALFLSYYDTFYNDSIIPDSLTHSITGTITTWNKAYASDNSYKKDISQWENGPVITQGFHDYLICMNGLNPYSSSNLEANIYARANAVYQYFNNVAMNNVNYLDLSSNSGTTNLLATIENNQPVIMDVTGYTYQKYYGQYMTVLISTHTPVGENGNPPSHAVVCYGYRQISNQLYYKVHLGYPTICSNALLIVNNAITGYNTMTVSCTHTHSSNYIFDHGLQEHCMCPCQASSTYYAYTYIGNQDAIKCMTCNTWVYSDHDYIYNCINNINHRKSCLNCGHVYEDISHSYDVIGYTGTVHYLKCFFCGYNDYNSHLIQYTDSGNNLFHIENCSICSYSSNKDHNFEMALVNGTYRLKCTLCGRIYS